MITINLRYLDVRKHDSLSELELLGHTIATIDEQDKWYENDTTRDIKQNLSPHDWHNEQEYRDLKRFLENRI